MLLISALMFGAIWLGLTRTRVGLVIQAALTHPDMASALGHNVPRIFTLVFAAGTALAGTAGFTFFAHESLPLDRLKTADPTPDRTLANRADPRRQAKAGDWSGREDLNLRPHGPEPCALPGLTTPPKKVGARASRPARSRKDSVPRWPGQGSRPVTGERTRRACRIRRSLEVSS